MAGLWPSFRARESAIIYKLYGGELFKRVASFRRGMIKKLGGNYVSGWREGCMACGKKIILPGGRVFMESSSGNVISVNKRVDSRGVLFFSQRGEGFALL